MLRRLAAMRAYLRDINLGREPDASVPEAVGMGEEQMYDMYRLRPSPSTTGGTSSRPPTPNRPTGSRNWPPSAASTTRAAPAWAARAPWGNVRRRRPIVVENFHALRDRQTSDTPATPTDKDTRVNLLDWDGKGVSWGLFPKTPPGDADNGGPPSRPDRDRKAGPKP
ncbi:hypothetical protein GCM10027162_57770 [Streptomyces incanus]